MTSEQVYILVTYDGSDIARQAFGTAARFAKLMHASIVLVRIYHAPPDVWAHPDAEHRERELARLKAEWQAEIDKVAAEFSRQHGVSVEGQSRLLEQRWNVPGEILAAADECNAETICMATHGEGIIRRIFVGSVAQEVILQSKRPITLIRAGTEQ